MSGVIHGSSHKVLHLMRDPAPTLAVYWNYVARVNGDNVAWPSLKRLAEDTGWGTTAIADARQWLIDHKALEPVENYVRPLWRDLKPQPLTRKRNFDRALYFRPTGYIVVEGIQYDLLYVARNQEADRPDKPQVESDDLSDTTSGVISGHDGRQSSRDITPDVAELDSSSKTLGTKEKDSDAPSGGQRGDGNPKRERKPRARDPIMDTLAVYILKQDRETKLPGKTASWLGSIKSEIMTLYPDMTGDLLTCIFEWKKPYTPKSIGKIIGMIGDYQESHDTKVTQSSSVPAANRAEQALYAGGDK